MKNLIKILIASALVLGFAAQANSGSGAFGGSLNYTSFELVANSGSGAFGG